MFLLLKKKILLPRIREIQTSMKQKYYHYEGNFYTLNELSALFPNVKPTVLASRLKKGMTVDEAVAPQSWEECIPEKFRNKTLVICFDKYIPVFPELQPMIGQRYLAVPNLEGKSGKTFYIIQVGERSLIVYPGEFRILGIPKKCADQECTPPCGDKDDCEMYVDGYCIGVDMLEGETQ